jgi:hypothetical protein
MRNTTPIGAEDLTRKSAFSIQMTVATTRKSRLHLNGSIGLH